MANKKQLGQFKKMGVVHGSKKYKTKTKTNKSRAIKHLKRSKHMWHKRQRLS